MDLPDNLLDASCYWVAWVVWLPLFIRSLWQAPWGYFKDAQRFNVWLGMIVLLMLVWSLRAGVKPGLSMHLLGVTVFTLCFGRHLAFVGLSLVLLGITLNGAAGAFAFALNSLLLAGCGSLFSHWVYRAVSRFLPQHFFVYIFVNGFFGAGLVIVSLGLVLTLFLFGAGVYELDYLLSEYLPYFLLLGFSEAWLSGMIMTLFVVYRPAWVITFDDSRYLASK